MGGQVGSAPACYGSFLGFKSKHFSKIQNGRHKQRNGQHTPAVKKEIREKMLID
jgi:hypothetical protein